MISATESYLLQGATKGFDNIDYADLTIDAIAGSVSGIGSGLDKGTSRHLMTQGTQATKRIWNKLVHKGLKAAGAELSKAGKYYFSQMLDYNRCVTVSKKRIAIESKMCYS